MVTIVVVEDEFKIRYGLLQLISKQNMECKVIGEAENGYEGLKMVRDLLPDVVITDIRMPKMDGLEMIENIRKLNIDAKFIILTGYAEFEYAQKGLRLGVYDYLLKPVSISDVKDLLSRLVNPEAGEDKRQQAQYSKVIHDMVSVITQNYAQRLGLDTFADKYHLTPEYLSSLFAKETGSNFSSYVKAVRMEKAKELLLNSNMKIYDIAIMVGYPDQKYFSKVFKEYTGVSAKEYVITNREGIRIY